MHSNEVFSSVISYRAIAIGKTMVLSLLADSYRSIADKRDISGRSGRVPSFFAKRSK